MYHSNSVEHSGPRMHIPRSSRSSYLIPSSRAASLIRSCSAAVALKLLGLDLETTDDHDEDGREPQRGDANEHGLTGVWAPCGLPG